MMRNVGRLILGCCILAFPHMASASTLYVVGYQSEINTNNNFIAFYNSASSQANISQVFIYLGDNAVFDVAGHNSDGLAQALVSTSSTKSIPISHFGTTWTADTTTAQIGLVGLLASSVTDLSHAVTLSFTNFTPGSAWGFFVDFDAANGASAQPDGAD